MSPTVYRIVLVVLGVICFVLAYVFRLDSLVHDALLSTGGLLIGTAGFKRPGDVSVDGNRNLPGPGVLALCLCATLSVSSACHALNALWPAAVKCAPTVTDLVAEVSQILLTSGDPQGDLDSLARDQGAEEVICVVDTLVRDWSSPAAAPNPQRAIAVARGKAFLAKTGTKVSR